MKVSEIYMHDATFSTLAIKERWPQEKIKQAQTQNSRMVEI